MNSKEVVKLLKKDGWNLIRVKGSHHVFVHDVKKGIVVVPMHNKDLAPGTLISIYKQAGLK